MGRLAILEAELSEISSFLANEEHQNVILEKEQVIFWYEQALKGNRDNLRIRRKLIEALVLKSR